MASAGEGERSKPNILITGTPGGHTHTHTHARTHTHTHTHTQGTGKSLTSSEVANQTGLAHIDVGTLAKEHDLFEGWDEQFQCPILDEDKVTIKLFYV